MNRIEFMTTLASFLQDVPEDERREAMKYYNDYFDDAGNENEEQVIRELGSPEKIASTIKAGIDGYENECGEFTDAGYYDTKFENRDVPEMRDDKQQQNETEKKERWTSKPLKVVLIIAIILCAIPIFVPIVLGLLVAVVGCILALFATIAALIVAAIAVAISGVAVFVTGVITMFGEFAAGLALAGIGLILIPVGAIATVALAKLCIVVFPVIVRVIVRLIRRPFERKAVA